MSSSPRKFHLFHGTKALKGSDPEVRRLKRKDLYHSAHGNKVWRSSFVLMDYFLTYPVPRGCKVIDAGCGWGLSGIFLAQQFNARVVGYDIDENVEPFLKLQAELNQVNVAFKKKSFQKITKADMSDVHCLIGADICFWDELTPVIYKLIRRALKAGVQRVVIADPGRPPFWDLADRCAKQFDAEVLTRSINEPVKTKKQLLVVGESPEE